MILSTYSSKVISNIWSEYIDCKSNGIILKSSCKSNTWKYDDSYADSYFKPNQLVRRGILTLERYRSRLHQIAIS